MLYPLLFEPIFKERIWGGRNLQRLYQKPLPLSAKIGESWEITDRPEGVSEISDGPLAGKDLRWVIENYRKDLLGRVKPSQGRFPLLVKILDAQEKLSVQVHPPAGKAAEMGGEPKTEMWYIAEAAPDAELYAGLKRGVTREEFERRIKDGTVNECLHRIPVRTGDAIFLPSGRVHAIGGGLVIFEIQQNSDTTYRVFDWNRVDDYGKSRELHVAESLASIDFNDFEPALIAGKAIPRDGLQQRPLVDDALFKVDSYNAAAGAVLDTPVHTMEIIGVITGRVRVQHDRIELPVEAGQFCLIPANLDRVRVISDEAASFLSVRAGAAMEH